MSLNLKLLYPDFIFTVGKSSHHSIFVFEEFKLDALHLMLYRANKEIQLPPKAVETLVLLVEQRGEILTKDELMESLWADSVVEESNLSKYLHLLRTTLGNREDGNPFIETLRRRGYRFTADVQVVSQKRREVPSQDNSSLVTPTSNENAGKLRTAIFASGFALLLLVAGITANLYFSNSKRAQRISSERGTSNDEAYQLYVQSVNLSEERGVQNLLKSLEYVERAVVADPNYARAWAGVAQLHRDIASATESDSDEHYQKSMAAVNKALAIDPGVAEAYSALCENKFRYEYDFAGAEAECRRAIEIDSDSPAARKTYALFLYSRGRFDEAIVEIKKAMDLQPVSYRNQQIYGLTLFHARRYAEAEAHFRRLLELNPNHAYIYAQLENILEQQGKESDAFDHFIKRLTTLKSDEGTIDRYKSAFTTSGWLGVTRERIDSPVTNLERGPFHLACQYAKLGDKDKAFEHLERAYRERSYKIAVLQVTPQLDVLRGDPRFIDLVRRIDDK